MSVCGGGPAWCDPWHLIPCLPELLNVRRLGEPFGKGIGACVLSARRR